jgi:hypothetical protein
MSYGIITPQQITWRPWGTDVTTLPFAKATTDAHREIAARYDEWRRRLGNIDRLSEAYQDARQTALLARQALEAEQAREVDTGTIGQSPAMKVKLQHAIAAADENRHYDRVKAAEQLAHQAHMDFVSSIDNAVPELLDELRPEADEVAADWHAAQPAIEELRKQIDAITAPLHERHAAVQERVNAVIGRTPEFVPVEVEPGVAPFPSEEQFAKREAFLHPEPEEPVSGGIGWVERPEREGDFLAIP